jgi:hypothetical protein
MRRFRSSFAPFFLLAALACEDNTSYLPVPPDTAIADRSPYDLPLCQQICGQLASCGLNFNPTCVEACVRTPLLLACARSGPMDCNSLALCRIRAWSAVYCGGELAAYPTGQEGCFATTNCERVCAISNPSDACYCGCSARMAPDRALLLLLNDECMLNRCAVCRSSGNTAACTECLNTKCAAESARCSAQ